MINLNLTGDAVVGGPGFDRLDALTRDGTVRRVRRGAYEAVLPGELDPVREHRVLIEATVRQTPTRAVLSHASAAVMHDLPTWNDELRRVHFTRDQGGRGKIRRYVHLHTSPLPREDVCMIDGLEVTSLARTVMDLARTWSMQRAVAVGDVALARGDLDLPSVAARCYGWPGMAEARRVMDFVDPRSESPGESVSRVVLHEAGVAPPEPQFVVLDPAGQFVARSDFGWEAMRTLGEYDGLVKYGRLLKPGQSAADVIVEEKRREDALRELGWQIVRWMWEDLQHPMKLRERLERAFERGRRYL